jgi:hypothetical protein
MRMLRFGLALVIAAAAPLSATHQYGLSGTDDEGSILRH